MPDDTKATNDGAEITEQDQEAMTAFDEDSEAGKDKGDVPHEAATDKDKGGDQDGEEGKAEAEKGKGKTEKEVEDLTPDQKKAADYAKELEAAFTASPGKEEPPPRKEEPPPKKEEPPPKKEDEAKKPASKKLTKEDIASMLSSVSLEELPDGEIVIGNETIDLKAFKNLDEDSFNSVIVLSNLIAKKQFDAMAKNGGFLTPKDVEEIKTQSTALKQELDGLRNYIKVAQEIGPVHADWEKIINSKEFDSWLKTDSDGLKAQQKQLLAYSENLEHGKSILSVYKHSKSMENVSKRDREAADKKKNFDDLHKDTTRSGVKAKGAGTGESAAKDAVDEAEAAFNEDD